MFIIVYPVAFHFNFRLLVTMHMSSHAENHHL